MRENCLERLMPKNFGVFATVIVILTYNVLLDKDVQCTCKPQKTQCDLYMTLPIFIIFFLVFWMDKTFQTTWKYLCICKFTRCSMGFFLVLLHHILRAALVGLLWVASVLIDGDWYVCCQSDQSESKLACKDNKTAEEKAVIAELRNYSKVIGFSTLFCLIIVGTLMSMVDWRRCCEEQCNCRDRKVLYHKLILEEGEAVLEDILRKSAVEQLTEVMIEKIRNGNWQECFNVVETVMERNPEPREQHGITTTAGEATTTPRPRGAPSKEQTGGGPQGSGQGPSSSDDCDGDSSQALRDVGTAAVEECTKRAKETDPLLRKGHSRRDK